jgi:hypothetical protein
MKAAPTCFSLHKPSSECHSQCLAKLTMLVPMYLLLWMYLVLWRHMLPDDRLYKPKHVGAAFMILF